MTQAEDDFFENEDYFLPFKKDRKETQREQAATPIPPEVWQAIQYLEYRKLRHKHPHV